MKIQKKDILWLAELIREDKLLPLQRLTELLPVHQVSFIATGACDYHDFIEIDRIKFYPRAQFSPRWDALKAKSQHLSTLQILKKVLRFG